MSSNLPIAATKPTLERPVVLATFFQALADPTRVRILELLAERPMTVSELVASLGLAQGRVSAHLTCLRWCGDVRAEVDGRFNRYALVDDRIRSDPRDRRVDHPRQRRPSHVVPGPGDRGAVMTRRVELLWFADCANHSAARRMLEEVIAERAPGTPIIDVDASDPVTAEHLRFPGSPTIRVEGLDVDPTYADPGDYTPRCRLYRTSDGLRGLPERSWIEDALRA